MIKFLKFIVCLLLSYNISGQIATNSSEDSFRIIGGMKKDCEEKIIEYLVPASPNNLNENNNINLIDRYSKWDLTEDYLTTKWNEIDQGAMGSCTAFAVAYAITIQRNIDNHLLKNHRQLIQYSPSFIFNVAKGKYREPFKSKCDEGISFIDAYLAVKENGLSTIEKSPYKRTIDGCTSTYYPTKAAFIDAKNMQIGNFQRPARLITFFKSLLSTPPFHPICIGVYLSSEYEKALTEKGRKGSWKIPGYSTRTMMHAMLIVGFDDDKNAFKVLDWKGKKYGDNGAIWMDYSLIENQNVVFDAYIVSHSTEYLDPKTGIQPGQTKDFDPTTKFSFWIKSGYEATKGDLHIYCNYTNYKTKKATFKITDEKTGELVKDDIFLTAGGESMCFTHKDSTYKLTLVEIAKRGNILNAKSLYAAVVRIEKISAVDCK
ncbi:C1 family peptidase [Chryseobacterium sp. MMS23-Vi53]|uniref:C1 family peptidase n=1 Tax=Chryseobacterium sp. MMS23-Vi53 TaxID=3386644 RepID=UPI0039EAA98E